MTLTRKQYMATRMNSSIDSRLLLFPHFQITSGEYMQLQSFQEDPMELKCRRIFADMLLQFITASDIGPKERKLIRAHVMKGKNLGRPRRQRRGFRDTKPVADHPGVIAAKAESLPVARDMNCGRTLGLIRLFWHDLSLTSFPYPIHSDSRKFVYQCE